MAHSRRKRKQTITKKSNQTSSTPLKCAAPDIKDNPNPSQVFASLNVNEHQRYLPSNKHVGHAVITTDKDGNKIAWQYNIPAGTGSTIVHPLINIQEVHPKEVQSREVAQSGIAPDNLTRYQAETADEKHIPMYAKRFVRAKVGQGNQQRDIEIACFSPKRDNTDVFWGSSEKDIPLFRNNLSKEEAAALKKELAELKTMTKGGSQLVIDPPSVIYRDQNKTRRPDQNTVMGESAVNAYEAFLRDYEDELSPGMKKILAEAVHAPLHNMFHGQRRPEWLHAYGFSLTPKDRNPQRADNLGAAPKWANTEMMVLERIAKWFALNQPHVFIAIKPNFEMLLDSELIKKVHFEVTLKDKENWIQFLQDINPFKPYPIFNKPSDLAQSTVIAHNLINNVKPISETLIASSNVKTAQGSNAMHSSSTTNKTTTTIKATAQKPSITSTAPIDPTHLQHGKSIVKVMVTSHEPDYDEPWLGSHIVNHSGTGFVIQHGEKKYVLTNAHCAENSVYMRVRLSNHRKEYKAIPKCVSYQCDLALLEVSDTTFDSLTDAVEFGEMVHLEQNVDTVGFPMGGNEISISRGIVSRIEVRSYVESGLDMLQVQVDAAVNPGNSGGPVFSNGKVVGVAFQGYNRQGLGYIIPMPIVKHFLQEAFSNKPYRGFPVLPITLQPLKNSFLKTYYGLTEDQSGMRVNKVDTLSDAFKKLKTDDILLEIDGFPLSGDGKINVPDIGKHIAWEHICHMKYIGDTVSLKVLRKNPETKLNEIQELSVVLDSIPYDTTKVSAPEHDKMPTYYFTSGVSFVPLTRNYMEGRGADFEEFYVCEEASYIADAPKKFPDEQVVVINDVLICETNEGYGSYEGKVVKEVNGKPIKNLRELIAAIEANDEPLHHIITSDKRVMVLKNMSKEEHAELLQRYHIASDRSEDLQKPINIDLITATKPASSASPSSSSDDVSQEVDESEDMEFNSNEEAEEINDADIDESAEEAEINAEAFRHTNKSLPGVQHFRRLVDQLEEKYKDADDDEETDDDFIPNEDQDESMEEEKEHEAPIVNEQEKINHYANTHRFFKKRPADENSEDDTEFQHRHKRARTH